MSDPRAESTNLPHIEHLLEKADAALSSSRKKTELEDLIWELRRELRHFVTQARQGAAEPGR
ncbi:hypothetical protein [Streptomyces sp. NPDC057702]|uniref:hypothetical protein n=1 Tax=unclassified Streptomyces TaxID=2593676 RepID=UPI00367E5EE4